MLLACEEARGDESGSMSTNPFTTQEEIIMKRQITVGMLLAAGLLIWGAGHPERVWSDPPCSLRTLKGTYLYHCAGVQGGDEAHFAFAGKDHFNGDGKATGVFSYSDKDNILHHVSYTGAYTVNPDCTGAYTTVDENGAVGNLDLFFGPDGAEVTFLITDPGFVDAGVERRVGK